MRKSHAISLLILGAAMLTAGCGSRSRTFYDALGKAVPRSQWRDASGQYQQLYDANGQLVPQNEVIAAYNSNTSNSYRRSSTSWGGGSFWGGSRSGFGTSSHSTSSS